MRIIAGSCKGRILRAPSWDGLRPTSDRLRETLFNILTPRVHGARVLDVFAGTGAIGLEALSRGADRAVFVDHDARAAKLVAANAARCGVSDRCVIIRQAAREAFRHSLQGPFDIVVLDPPYALTGVEELLIDARVLVRSSGVLVLEHAWRREAPTVSGQKAFRTVRAGDSALSFYEGAHSESVGRP